MNQIQISSGYVTADVISRNQTDITITPQTISGSFTIPNIPTPGPRYVYITYSLQ